jgi:predicted dienelactone hydrolase
VTVQAATLRLRDPARRISVGSGVVPRSFDTVIRYPVGLPGPFPLIVFGHGYNVTPAPYHDLLDAWARAGYVVAAPIFPLENANAPGGANENDLPNQPEDMSLVISSLTRPPTPDAARIAGLVNPSEIAVAGQSDGGDTALAAAYDPSVRDTRIKAAVILSGAQDPFARPFAMPHDGPPLLAVQGTADTINPPEMTYAFYDQAAPPKYLLKLIGAGHQPPYTEPGPALTIVEHMSLAFLNRYLKGHSRALPRYVAARSAGPSSVLTFQG